MASLSGDDIARLGYFVLLLIAVGGIFVTSGRANLGRNIQMFLIWGLIFLGVIAGYGLWPAVRNTILPSQQIVSDNTLSIPQQRDGHYYVTATINGTDIELAIDTGASTIVLSQADARKIGLDPDNLAFSSTALTANGQVATARVWLETFDLGPFSDSKVPATVNRGDLDVSLLGMSYLSTFPTFSISNSVLVLAR